jgi:predicted nucleotidyltransferase
MKATLAEMAEYRATAYRRRQQEQQALEHRRKQAWELAQRAAVLLRARFGATRVVVFGSLVHEATFTRWSDVDIAAWGISPRDTFRAVGAVMDMDSEIEVNLADVAACRPSLLDSIERDGVDL